MQYSINPMIYTNMFPMPTCIADEHIKKATLPQMKIVLWLFRHSTEIEFSSADIARAIGLYESEVDDAIKYWTECGVVVKAGETAKAVAAEAKTEEAAEAEKEDEEEAKEENKEAYHPKKNVENITINPPTHEEFARRCKESKYIRELLLVTEQRLGTTLSFSMQSTLMMLHDDYGLTVEVISLAVEYAISRGKANARFIANIGRKWCENEIDTIDKAMDYIEQMTSADKYWSEFRDKTGAKNPSPTKAQREFLHSWINNMGFSMDMVILAYEEMAENTGKFSFPYMNKILINWSKEGLKTPEDVAKAKKERHEKKSGKAKSKAAEKEEKAPASYDIDAYRKKAFANPMNILRKEEN